jgi:hypothetical protein
MGSLGGLDVATQKEKPLESGYSSSQRLCDLAAAFGAVL